MMPCVSEIEILIPQQRLVLRSGSADEIVYPVSTAANGPGEASGSQCTPRGQHVIRASIGAGCEINSVFVGRRATSEVWSEELAARQPGRDWILTRILWLSGLETGFNRLGEVDTMRRFIYIHGTPYEAQIGKPVSGGCIRMRNVDIIDLHRRVQAGTLVNIRE